MLLYDLLELQLNCHPYLDFLIVVSLNLYYLHLFVVDEAVYLIVYHFFVRHVQLVVVLIFEFYPLSTNVEKEKRVEGAKKKKYVREMNQINKEAVIESKAISHSYLSN